MDFEQRAIKAYERGDAVRAVVQLAEGLKRHPDRREVAERLVVYYVEGLDSPGLERDVVSGLRETPEAEAHLREIQTRLRGESRDKMARNFERAVDEAGFELRPAGAPSVDESAGGAAPDEVETSVPPSGPSKGRGGASAPAGETGESSERSRAGSVGSRRSEAEQAEYRREPPAAGSREGSTSDDDSRVVREVEARGPSGPVEQTEPAREWRWPKWVAGGIAAVVVVAGVGFAIWEGVQRAGEERRLNREIAQLDPLGGPRLTETTAWRGARGLAAGAKRERRQFTEAIRALERGEASDTPEAPQTRWGRGAVAASSLAEGEGERAVRMATRLRRTRPEGDLVRIWTNARVAEFLGRPARAQRLYRQGLERHARFVPFATGALRVAFVRMDGGRLDELSESLGELSEEHPYLVLGDVAIRPVDAVSETEHAPIDEAPGSAFLRRVRAYQRAVAAFDGREYEEVIDETTGLLEEDGGFGPALWLRAVARGLRFELEGADADAERLVELGGLSESFRWRFRAILPALFTAAGRPDLGARYVVADGGPIARKPREAGDGEPPRLDERETIALQTAHWPSGGASQAAGGQGSWRRRAEVARVRVLLELGHLDRAGRRVEGLLERRDSGTGKLRLLEAEIEARRGVRPGGSSQAARASGSAEARLVDAYHAGRYVRAVEIGTELLESAQPAKILRYVVLSHAATDRPSAALQMLESREFSLEALPVRRRLRGRVHARLGDEVSLAGEVDARMLEMEPTSIRAAVDLGTIALWTGRIEEAGEASRRALDRAPASPGAHRLRALVSAVRGDREEAEEHFRRAWRAGGDRVRRSLEVGYLNLALGRPGAARDRFYEAYLASPTSLEAIRGMGRAYHAYSDRAGRRNVERIYEHYRKTPQREVQAGELERWLGVFDGVREGTREGKTHLDRAIDGAGRRPPWLLELARWHRARRQFDRARELYREAVQEDSSLAAAHLGLANMADATDNESAAKKHFARFLELKPVGSDADRARERLAELGGSPPGASGEQ